MLPVITPKRANAAGCAPVGRRQWAAPSRRRWVWEQLRHASECEPADHEREQREAASAWAKLQRYSTVQGDMACPAHVGRVLVFISPATSEPAHHHHQRGAGEERPSGRGAPPSKANLGEEAASGFGNLERSSDAMRHASLQRLSTPINPPSCAMTASCRRPATASALSRAQLPSSPRIAFFPSMHQQRPEVRIMAHHVKL